MTPYLNTRFSLCESVLAKINLLNKKNKGMYPYKVHKKSNFIRTSRIIFTFRNFEGTYNLE